MPDAPQVFSSQPGLRLWPGWVLAILVVILRFGMPLFSADQTGEGMLAGAAGGLLIVLWWIFFSRAPWLDRLAIPAFAAVCLLASKWVVHPSIAGGGMGYLLYIHAVTFLGLGIVVAATLTRAASVERRRMALLASVILVCLGFASIRTGGIDSTASSDLAWRWSPTPEERLLAQAPKGTSTAKAASAASAADEWPGFRGARRDGVVHTSTVLATDWATTPPRELWRGPVGPAWSSFAVRGDFFYTQEQRGEEELVSCYRTSTGEPIWQHRDVARFYESNAGAGPRSTPTLAGDRVYTFGATGILNVLDAATGEKIWSRPAAEEAGVATPTWGFSSSPLVVGQRVIVAISSHLKAYDAETGVEAWSVASPGTSHSSPQLMTIEGIEQVVLVTKKGALAVDPNDGRKLWDYDWEGFPIVQPALTPDGELLLSTGDSSGIRRVGLKRGAENAPWEKTERWASLGLKPYFNDFVVHRGHAFGFDGAILSCIDLADGQRKWKGGRYGRGQLILLAAQDLLLVLSEKGELALVKALPDRFEEVARVSAITGKTWNHPVLVQDVVLVRNDQEMAAFRLPTHAP